MKDDCQSVTETPVSGLQSHLLPTIQRAAMRWLYETWDLALGVIGNAGSIGI